MENPRCIECCDSGLLIRTTTTTTTTTTTDCLYGKNETAHLSLLITLTPNDCFVCVFVFCAHHGLPSMHSCSGNPPVNAYCFLGLHCSEYPCGYRGRLCFVCLLHVYCVSSNIAIVVCMHLFFCKPLGVFSCLHHNHLAGTRFAVSL